VLSWTPLQRRQPML